jgi:hypothetical protein
MATIDDEPESGTLPSRIEWVREIGPMTAPTDPEWNRFSDTIRSFEAEAGPSYGAQEAVGSAYAQDHFRGTESPSLTVVYDLQEPIVDGSDNPNDASADGLERGTKNGLLNTHTVVERQESGSQVGPTSGGTRTYTVARGCYIESVEATLDPDEQAPIPLELGYQPREVRSYKIHQPASSTNLDIVSTDDNDTMDIVIENEGASTSNTETLNGTTPITSTDSFGDIDVVWLKDAPAGDITVSDGSGTNYMTIYGGNTYSDDGTAVDGDRGIPPLGSGSHASAIGTDYEHFVGDTFERPTSSSVRTRVNSASWTVENDIETNPLHDSRYPAISVNGATVTVEADIAGPFASHEAMMDALIKDQADLVHEMDNTKMTFENTIPQGTGRTREAGSAVESYGEEFIASGDPAINITQP